MDNKNSAWCSLIGVICYVMGISLVTTLIFIPLAIYCFIGGGKYFEFAKMTDVQLSNHKDSLKNWAIFVSIVGFPIGLISIIPFVNAGNKVSVTDVKSEQAKNENKSETENKENGSEENVKKEAKSSTSESNLSDNETIEKLKKFREEGLITEAEYKRALSELKKE